MHYTIISPSVIWKTNVPSFVWSFHLFSPPNSPDTQLIVTSAGQITGLNLTTGNVLWNISAGQEFKNIYPKLIGWSYSADRSTLIDSDKDGVPELWVTEKKSKYIKKKENLGFQKRLLF